MITLWSKKRADFIQRRRRDEEFHILCADNNRLPILCHIIIFEEINVKLKAQYLFAIKQALYNQIYKLDIERQDAA